MDTATTLYALLIYAAVVAVLVTVMIALSYVLGEKHTDPATGTPYESGIRASGSARSRFPSYFYLVALFFVIFDLEAAFLFGWALAAEEAGMTGFWGALVFTVILTIALLYEWRIGALDWASRGTEVEGKRRSPPRKDPQLIEERHAQVRHTNP